MKGSRKQWMTAAALAAIASFAPVGADAATATEKAAGVEVVEGSRVTDAAAILRSFAAWVKADGSINAQDKAWVARTVERALADNDLQATAIADCLAKLYPRFNDALVDLAQDRTAAALKTLRDLSPSDNPYLAAHAEFYAARALVSEQRYEDAAPLFRGLIDKSYDKTASTGEAMFYLAVCQQKLMDFGTATQTFKDFLEEYGPDSGVPSRLRITAVRELAGLLDRNPDDPMTQVKELMESAGRRLALADAGKATQDEQARIVALLDEMIPKADQTRCPPKPVQPVPPNGFPPPPPVIMRAPDEKQPPVMDDDHKTANPSSGDNKDILPIEGPPPGKLVEVPVGPDWRSQDRNRTRGAAVQVATAEISDRYRDLATQYFENISREDDDAP